MNRNALPPSLVANLQQVLVLRKTGKEEAEEEDKVAVEGEAEIEGDDAEEDSRPAILVTNGDGIESPGLIRLVEGLVREGRYRVYVCAPQFDKSASGHSLTVQESVEVSSFEIEGATAFAVSGTSADCVTLALSEALFSWTKPVLVVSGINRGPNCGQNLWYSGAVAGAREALLHGVPSLCISLHWKKDVSSENDLKEAVDACLPLIHTAAKDIENAVFPQSCLLNVELPAGPSTNKGFRVTRQSLWRSSVSWNAVSSYKHPAAGSFMANQQSLGLQLAQLSRDASAAGAARRLHTNKKNVEVESVGAAGKPNSRQIVRKHYRLEFLEKDGEGGDEDLDIVALQNGYVTITPIALSSAKQSEVQSSVSNWLSTALSS
ncbi:5'-nucleotidase SurE-like protein [Drosera capensis]